MKMAHDQVPVTYGHGAASQHSCSPLPSLCANPSLCMCTPPCCASKRGCMGSRPQPQPDDTRITSIIIADSLSPHSTSWLQLKIQKCIKAKQQLQAHMPAAVVQHQPCSRLLQSQTTRQYSDQNVHQRRLYATAPIASCCPQQPLNCTIALLITITSSQDEPLHYRM